MAGTVLHVDHPSLRRLLVHAFTIGALALALIPRATAQNVQETAPAQVPKVPASQPSVEYNGPRLGVHLPALINPGDLLGYISIMQLSDAQAQYLRVFYQHYATRASELLDEGKGSFELLSIEGGKGYAIGDWDRVAEFGILLSTEVEKLREKIRRLDQDLFDKLQTVLADPQLPLLERAKSRRSRQICILQDSVMGASKCDLSVFAERHITEPDDQTLLIAAMIDYETQLNWLFERLDKSLLQNRTKGRLLDAERVRAYADKSENGPLRVRELQRQGEAVWHEQARIQRRIVNLNDMTVLALASKLSKPKGEWVLDDYRRLFYSKIFPDPLDPQRVFDKAVSDKGLAEGVVAALQEQYRTFRASWDQLSTKMQEAYNDWREQFASTFSAAAGTEHKETMRQLRQQRMKLDRDFVAAVQSQVRPGPFDPLISDSLRHIDDQMKAAKTDHYPDR